MNTNVPNASLNKLSSSEDLCIIDNDGPAYKSTTEEPVITKNNFICNACKGQAGVDRKNIPKFLLRKLIAKFIKSPEFFYRELKEKMDIERGDLEGFRIILLQSAKDERYRGLFHKKMDYVKTLNLMSMNPLGISIINILLKDLIKQFNKGKYGKINRNNINSYRKTLELLYSYSQKLIEKEEFWTEPQSTITED